MSSTSIRLEKSTRDKLARYGNLDSSFDSVINEILDDYENLKKSKGVRKK